MRPPSTLCTTTNNGNIVHHRSQNVVNKIEDDEGGPGPNGEKSEKDLCGHDESQFDERGENIESDGVSSTLARSLTKSLAIHVSTAVRCSGRSEYHAMLAFLASRKTVFRKTNPSRSPVSEVQGCTVIMLVSVGLTS
jgi:hypothetical protein